MTATAAATIKTIKAQNGHSSAALISSRRQPHTDMSSRNSSSSRRGTSIRNGNLKPLGKASDSCNERTWSAMQPTGNVARPHDDIHLPPGVNA